MLIVAMDWVACRFTSGPERMALMSSTERGHAALRALVTLREMAQTKPFVVPFDDTVDIGPRPS